MENRNPFVCMLWCWFSGVECLSYSETEQMNKSGASKMTLIMTSHDAYTLHKTFTIILNVRV